MTTSNLEMACLEEDRSNSLFDVLEEWEAHLAHYDLDGLRCGDDNIAP